MNLTSQLKFYIEKKSSQESDLLKKILIQTHQKVEKPHMISDFLQGRLLSMFSKMIRPKRILEIGTFTGYSTLCMSEGLSDNGKIFTIDKNQKLYDFCHENFRSSIYSNQIKFLNGNAVRIIPTLDESFDLVFLDADKKNYSLYLELVKPKLNKGGFILADNVLYHGKVIDNKPDKLTQYLLDFNNKVKQDSDFEVIILPIRDGISLIRKK